jgi:hypothetical protein
VVIFLINISISVASTTNRAKTFNTSLDSMDSNDEYHLIENVPYVSQETNFYCYYACLTMIFKFYGINTTLGEVLHHSGVGYTSLYSKNLSFEADDWKSSYLWERYPEGGTLISQSDQDRHFLSELYGLQYFDTWRPDDKNLTEEESWQQYWSRVKENISQDIPVNANIFPFLIPAYWNNFSLENIPEKILDLLPVGGHDILIVGYNESSEDLIISDPAFGYMGSPELGNYTSMPIKFLRKYSIRRLYTFKKDAESLPLTKMERFQLAHKRNLERMRGNKSVYDEEWRSLPLGIDAIKEFKKDLQIGIKNRFTTYLIYKQRGTNTYFKKAALIILSKIIPFIDCNSLDINKFTRIGIEKLNISNYLYEEQHLSSNCTFDALLLKNEMENWTKISDLYNNFIKKNIKMTLLRAITIIKEIDNTIDNIIKIEEKILVGQ